MDDASAEEELQHARLSQARIAALEEQLGRERDTFSRHLAELQKKTGFPLRVMAAMFGYRSEHTIRRALRRPTNGAAHHTSPKA